MATASTDPVDDLELPEGFVIEETPQAPTEPVPEPPWWRAILRRIGAALGVEQDKRS
jgi:hypothetical protein